MSGTSLFWTLVSKFSCLDRAWILQLSHNVLLLSWSLVHVVVKCGFWGAFYAVLFKSQSFCGSVFQGYGLHKHLCPSSCGTISPFTPSSSFWVWHCQSISFISLPCWLYFPLLGETGILKGDWCGRNSLSLAKIKVTLVKFFPLESRPYLWRRFWDILNSYSSPWARATLGSFIGVPRVKSHECRAPPKIVALGFSRSHSSSH